MPDKIYLQYYIMKRMLKLLVRKSKNLRLVYFTHSPLSHDPEKLTIKYKFSNALYYAINGDKIISNNILVDKPSDKETNLTLTVYGFFRKSEYVISVYHNDVSISRLISSKAQRIQKAEKIYYVSNNEDRSDANDNSREYSVA